MWILASNAIVTLYLIINFVKFVKSDCDADSKRPSPKCFTKQQLQDAIAAQIPIVESTEKIIKANIDYPGYRVDESMAGYLHFHASPLITPEYLKQQKAALVVTYAKQALFKTSGLTKTQFRNCLFQIGFSVNISNLCTPVKPPCDFSTTNYYRTDGFCGNPKDPLATAVDQPMFRLFENSHEDGIDITSNTFKTVNPRELVLQIQRVRGPAFDQRNTHNDFATFYGQIVTHDMMKTLKSQYAVDGGGFYCCNPKQDPKLDDLIRKNPHCMPISVNPRDPHFSGCGMQCMNYIRNLKVLKNCAVDSDASPLNTHTPVLDFELVYNERTLKHLASNRGKFNLDFDVIDELFTGYDDRTHQMPGLMFICHMFAKFHNIVFDKLRDVFSVSDLVLGNEARRITTAVYQKSTVDYFLSLIPPDVAEIFSIRFETCFDPAILPQVSLEFNSAFRFLHNFLKDEMQVYSKSLFHNENGVKGNAPDSFKFNQFVENMTWFRDNACGTLHGMLDRSWNLGSLGPEIIGRFFRPQSDSKCGLDLRSFDFQFGKEMGEVSYCKILREVHSMPKQCDDDVTEADFRFHDANSIRMIKEKYKRLCDCPASFAADLEIREFDPVGITTGMIIGEQVSRTMCGDPFFFTNAKIFKSHHRRRIKRMGIRDVICLYLNCNGTKVQEDPFLSHGSENLKSACDLNEIMKRFDLDNWQLTQQ